MVITSGHFEKYGLKVLFEALTIEDEKRKNRRRKAILFSFSEAFRVAASQKLFCVAEVTSRLLLGYGMYGIVSMWTLEHKVWSINGN